MSIICMKHCSQLLRRSVDSLNLLQGLSHHDESARHDAILTILRVFDSWYFGFGSPAVAGFLETVVKDTGGATLDTSMHGLIREQIPDLLRISQTGPSAEIRSAARDILVDLKTKKGFKIPRISIPFPSFTLSLAEMKHMLCITDEPSEGDDYYTTYILFREYWFHWGRLCNYISVMGYHPEYLECYMKLQDHLFHGDLPLPYPDRYYLAVIAAAEQRCIYLILLFARQFLSSGGPAEWLQGIQHGPTKWRQLCALNRDLAGQPWKITSKDIYNLTHGGRLNISKETISLSELMHAVAIFTQVHALACFIFSCGICPEIDHYNSFLNNNTCNNSDNTTATTTTTTTNNNNDSNSNNTNHNDSYCSTHLLFSSKQSFFSSNNDKKNINTNNINTTKNNTTNYSDNSNDNDHIINNNDNNNNNNINNNNNNGSVDQFNTNGDTRCECILQPWNDNCIPKNGNIETSNSLNNSDSVVEDEEVSAKNLLKIIQTEDFVDEDVGEDIMTERFLVIIKENTVLNSELPPSSSKIIGYSNELYHHPMITRFLESVQSGYKNFDAPPFHVTEYSWQEEGFTLADRLCTNLGSLLDEKFRNAYELTYNTLNSITNVDTTLYRRTVWNQIQSLFGIFHDDFHYESINRLLTYKQRAYLKLCATFPSAINFNKQLYDYGNIFPALSPSEVVHVILMVIEARQQACLLYVLRAISENQAVR